MKKSFFLLLLTITFKGYTQENKLGWFDSLIGTHQLSGNDERCSDITISKIDGDGYSVRIGSDQENSFDFNFSISDLKNIDTSTKTFKYKIKDTIVVSNKILKLEIKKNKTKLTSLELKDYEQFLTWPVPPMRKWNEDIDCSL